MAGAAHHPFVDGSRGPQTGGLAVAACRDCAWAQAVNEDLHEGREDLLLAWHAADPGQGHDHLAERDPDGRLEIPGYVRWAGNGFGGLALADERTGGMHDSYNHQSLAIFTSVARDGDLEAAIATEARRLQITRRQATPDVLLIAARLYRSGLLAPARRPAAPA